VSGGSTATTACSNGTEQADWLARSTGSGVVFAHNFDSPNEVAQFRYSGGYGVDPSGTHGATIAHTTDGFAGGGSVTITTPSGGHANGGWWRPMARFRAGDNGKTVDDAGAGGTVKLRSWNSGNPGSIADWRGAYWGNAASQAANPTWQGQSDIWDGSDFYLQFRVKMPPSRWFGYNGPASSGTRNPYGKLLFIDVTGATGNEEIVIQSAGPDPGYFNSSYPFRMYTNFGSRANSFLSTPQGANTGAKLQAGGPFANTCTIGGNTTVANSCWEWPKDGSWVTVLIHVVPGTHNTSTGGSVSQWPHQDFGLEAWVARSGETAYTKVFQNMAMAWEYGTDNNLHPPGAFNSICPSAYMNGVPSIAGQGWFQRYTQIILSKQFIACPQV
jgi:hypothetical protein